MIFMAKPSTGRAQRQNSVWATPDDVFCFEYDVLVIMVFGKKALEDDHYPT